ncbi:diguanylate cyclase [Chromatiaceae bacterium AAb-1]|nr:diguanylate cyclase [Chromatiaceae bacterium AAb-1]
MLLNKGSTGIKSAGAQQEKMPLYYALKKGIKLVAVYPAIATVIVFVLLYYAISAYSDAVVRKNMLDILRKNISDISQREARLIEQKLQEVSSLAAVLQAEHQFYFSLPRDQHITLITEPVFATDNNGGFYKAEDNGGAAVYYSGDTVIGPEQFWKARTTERLDILYKNIVERNPVVDQVYFNSWDNMSRIYPFIDNSGPVSDPVRHISKRHFYYLADAEHNPDRNVIWTRAYPDPAGMGWMVSAIAPVYRGDFLEGVSGLDITLKSLIDHLFTSNMSSDNILLLDSSHTILAMSPAMSDLLSVPELTGYAYPGMTEDNVFKPGEFKLAELLGRPFRDDVQSLLENGQQLADISLHGVQYLVFRVTIKNTGWHLLTLLDISDVMQPLASLERMKVIIGWMAMALISLFALLYLRYVFYLSDRFSDDIVQPINALAERTSHFGEQGRNGLLPDSGVISGSKIREVTELVDNFNQMALELDTRTQKLVEANIARQIIEEKARLYQVMANTDQLTGLHNRKYIDITLRQEGIRANRYGSALTIIIIDVDHFKAVNDNFGHQVGDLALSRVAKTLKANIREVDILGRWGGEEFLLICPNTRTEDACILAEKLRAAVENIRFEQQLSITASIGIAQLASNERTEKTVARADAMLYKAKRNGRNRVEHDHGNS